MTSWLLVGCMLVVLATMLVVLRRTKHLSASQPPVGVDANRDVLRAAPFATAVIDNQLRVAQSAPSPRGLDVESVLATLAEAERKRLLSATEQALQGAPQSLRFSGDGRTLDAYLWSDAAGRSAHLWLHEAPTESGPSEHAERMARRHEAILRCAVDGIFVVADDGHFLEVNEAFCRMLGYSAAELRQRKLSDLETRDAVGGATATQLPTGLHHIARPYRHREGKTVMLETSVIVLREGERHILVGLARDATERLRFEQRLVRANERFAALVARMPLGYIAFAPDWIVREWNGSAEKVFGIPAGAAVGRDLRALVTTPEQRARLDEIGTRVAAGESSGMVVQQNKRADGVGIECEWFYTVIRDASGGVESIAAMVRDVSERERLEQELRRAQKLESLGILAGGVAHDFNNFLVTILCNASMLTERLPAGSEPARQVQKIVNASRRASELTRQMLTYAGGARLDVQPTDLGTLINEMLDFMRAAIPKNVALRVSGAAELPLIDADSGQLQQVILNLLINGAEAIGDKPGEVLISTDVRTLNPRQLADEFPGFEAAPGDFVCMRVTDNGCGMTRETAIRIFDPFFTTKFTGRGLGLATILGIVRSHRGAVRVQSELGRGTTFTVALPAGSRRIETRAAPLKSGRIRAGATLLVIDDDDDIRDVVQDLFGSRGVRVLEARDGEEGVETFRENAASIDAVLLDLTMPGMSGTEVFKQLRLIRPDARVILSSGYSEQEASTRIGSEQVVAFVQKPYTAGALVEKVGAALG